MRNGQKRTIVAVSIFLIVVTLGTTGLTLADQQTNDAGSLNLTAVETAQAWSSGTYIDTVGIWDDTGSNIHDFTSDGGTHYVDAGTVIDTVDTVVVMDSSDIVTESQSNARVTLTIEDGSGTVIFQNTKSITITSSGAGDPQAINFTGMNFTVNEGDTYTITSEYQGLVS